jgi:hypothetical protein
LPTISGGVSRDIREVLEVVQPYHGPKGPHGLALLRDLDNIDKHRRLVVVVAATQNTLSTSISGDPMAPPPSTTIFTRRPLEHDQVIAIVTYERPYQQPDPNLRFMPHIAFGDGESAVSQEPIRVVFGDLIFLVRDEVVTKFEKFFPK